MEDWERGRPKHFTELQESHFAYRIVSPNPSVRQSSKEGPPAGIQYSRLVCKPKIDTLELELLLYKTACHLNVVNVTARAVVWDVCAFEEESLAQTVPQVTTEGAKILMAPCYLPTNPNYIPPKS